MPFCAEDTKRHDKGYKSARLGKKLQYGMSGGYDYKPKSSVIFEYCIENYFWAEFNILRGDSL